MLQKQSAMEESRIVRVDKFLWAVRIFKTRSIAADECRKGRILINNVQVKPSRTLSRDEIIIVKKPPVSHTYRVINPIENRVSARLVSQFLEDLTPDEEKAKLDYRLAGGNFYREKGTGRPTKKERRLIDRIQDGSNKS